MPEPSQTTIYGASEPLRPATAPQTSVKAEPLFTAPQTMRGQLAMPTDRAPGPSDQTGRLIGPCDHPDYALSQDLPYGDGRAYCTLCGARAMPTDTVQR